jgi:hypothetical protein
MNNQSPINDRQSEEPGRSSWIIGVILIVLGGSFLIQNMGLVSFRFMNWWAFFILIPAIGAFNRALRYYRNANNQFTSQVSGSFLLGVVLSLVAVSFLFNIGWTYFGPILIILAGLGILLKAMVDRKE